MQSVEEKPKAGHFGLPLHLQAWNFFYIIARTEATYTWCPVTHSSIEPSDIWIAFAIEIIEMLKELCQVAGLQKQPLLYTVFSTKAATTM